MAKERIQKVLAAAGIASRRSVELMILEGRITVNGELVTRLPCFVGPGDEVLVDGQVIRKRPQRFVYILLNKPRGVVCSQNDPSGRPRAVDLIPRIPERVYCVGRLDVDSTGLILLTNDGELTQRLTHPRYEVAKTYIVRVPGLIGPVDVAKLRHGVFLDGRRTAGADVKVIRSSHKESLIQVRIAAERNRMVRRMLARLGHDVDRLHRAALGPISDRGLKIGNFRTLEAEEVAKLRRITGLESPSPR